MWQTSALGSLVAAAFSHVADKAAFVYTKTVDSYVATFYRQFSFLFLTCIVGYIGWMGTLNIFFNWEIVLYALISLPSSYFYTTLLRKVEITGIEAAACLSPLLFLAIDIVFMQAALSHTQVIAIVILTAGGFIFALDARTHRIKKELSMGIILIFAYSLFQDVVSFYTFKHLNTTLGVNGVSFYASTYLIVALISLLVVVGAGKGKLLLRHTSVHYMPLATLGKSFDVASSLLEMQAISFAAVSQVAAFTALEPLVVLAVTAFSQKEMRVRVRERLDSKNIHWKAAGVSLLVLGTLLIG